MRKLLVHSSEFIVLLFLFLLSTPNSELPTIYAADSSPSADIKTKLEELKKEIASKAAVLKKEVDRKLKDKAYVGAVKQKSDSTITLATESGPKIMTFNQDTVFESKVKPKKGFTEKNIALENYLAGLGDVDETGVLIAKKVILLPTPDNEPTKSHLWGQIVSKSGKLATLKGKDSKNVAISIPSATDISQNDFVILTGTSNKNDIFEAKFIYVYRKGSVEKPMKVATPAATLKPAAPPAKKS